MNISLTVGTWNGDLQELCEKRNNVCKAVNVYSFLPTVVFPIVLLTICASPVSHCSKNGGR